MEQLYPEPGTHQTSRRCPRCQQLYHYHLPLTWFQRNFLPFIKLKRYFCAKCLRPRTVWIRKGR